MSDEEQRWLVHPLPPPEAPRIELLPPPPLTLAEAAPRQDAKPRFGLALLLFLLTLFTTTTIGPLLYISARTDISAPIEVWLLTPRMVAWVWSNPALIRVGLSFSLPALFILLVHELGHYLVCRRYRIATTLPYFLPFPAALGTLGAFIRIRSPLRNRRELFDVGVAGPIAGFVALLPFLFIGIARSTPAPLRLARGESLVIFGHSLLMELATRLHHGRLADGMVLNLHPFAIAAWFGLLATAINLIPLSQLDGGHIFYAAAGRYQRRLAVPLWLLLALAGFFWIGWVIWSVVIVFIGLYHPPLLDERAPLDPRRRWLALAALLIFLLSFTPRALSTVEESPLATPAGGETHGTWAIDRLSPVGQSQWQAALALRTGRSGSPGRR